MSTQLPVTPEEQTFLNTISSALKEDYDRDLIIIGLRSLKSSYYKKGFQEAKTQLQRTGQSDWSVDEQWTDEQLKGKK